MIKANYKKVAALALTATTLFGLSVYSATETQKADEAIALYTPTEMTTEKYVAYYEGNDTFVTEDGDAWVYHNTNFNKGDGVVLTITNNGTVEKIDDVVTEIEAKPRYYDVPIDEKLQEHIIKTCEKYPSEINGVHLELVLAVIERESNYRHCITGDNGDSWGIMQIQPSQHEDRMERLEVASLLDPYQNVEIGIDYLAECLREYKTIEEALTVYNAGASGAEELYFSKGILCSPYASDVLDNWREICMSHVQ